MPHFTMERVHRGWIGIFKADEPGGLGAKVPQWGSGAKSW